MMHRCEGSFSEWIFWIMNHNLKFKCWMLTKALTIYLNWSFLHVCCYIERFKEIEWQCSFLWLISSSVFNKTHPYKQCSWKLSVDSKEVWLYWISLLCDCVQISMHWISIIPNGFDLTFTQIKAAHAIPWNNLTFLVLDVCMFNRLYSAKKMRVNVIHKKN